MLTAQRAGLAAAALGYIVAAAGAAHIWGLAGLAVITGLAMSGAGALVFLLTKTAARWVALPAKVAEVVDADIARLIDRIDQEIRR